MKNALIILPKLPWNYIVQKYVAGQKTAGGGWEPTTFNSCNVFRVSRRCASGSSGSSKPVTPLNC